jgi:hypothetical protein
MLPRLATLLTTHRRKLKAEWSSRLCAEPPNSALAMPEVLILRMDGTLDQLDGFLRSRSAKAWLARHQPDMVPLHEQCRCGLSPLLGYFVTGGSALEAALPGLAAEEKAVLDQAWHRLAQQEIQLLCGACCRSCAPGLHVAGDHNPAGTKLHPALVQ